MKGGEHEVAVIVRSGGRRRASLADLLAWYILLFYSAEFAAECFEGQQVTGAPGAYDLGLRKTFTDTVLGEILFRLALLYIG